MPKHSKRRMTTKWPILTQPHWVWLKWPLTSSKALSLEPLGPSASSYLGAILAQTQPNVKWSPQPALINNKGVNHGP